ncbi:hypothetical protein D9757_009589 [Collybiopsis confluens]|uniref:Uncharacterized protein n=1 Tax=Collybiopsis confluens TaxID=2823264 RepID=A0A8H5H4F0_9AGAR|nr:hypothetical protein D9757_009589 [Collybiopsis confluens]
MPNLGFPQQVTRTPADQLNQRIEIVVLGNIDAFNVSKEYEKFSLKIISFSQSSGPRGVDHPISRRDIIPSDYRQLVPWNPDSRLDKNHALVWIYRALAVHPVIAQFHITWSGGREFQSANYTVNLWSEDLNASTSTLLKNKHFAKSNRIFTNPTKNTAVWGMLLLLWIIGHHLPEDPAMKLVSTAVSSAMKASGSDSDLKYSFAKMESLKRGVISVRNMLPKNLHLFMLDFYANLASNVFNSEWQATADTYWAHRLPQNQQYQYNVVYHPAFLLEPLKNKVIIPRTKLTAMVLYLASTFMGIGHLATSENNIDPKAYWNAVISSEDRFPIISGFSRSVDDHDGSSSSVE